MINGRKLAVAFALLISTITAEAQMSVVPLPVDIKETSGIFSINPQTKISYDKGLKQQAELLAAALSPATGFDYSIVESKTATKNVIHLKIDKSISDNKEAYGLSVKDDNVVITGTTPAGVFYATQTLLQLLPVEIYSKERQKRTAWKIKGTEIKDQPLYPWRGMMLDVARYFFTKDYVLKFIDMMAMYKLNELHLHLVDDSGWRIEIKKYPKLTTVGAWRGEGANRVGGYYTQDDIKEMVAYAAARNINIIPEIELPAHTLSALAAYPHLGCRGKEYVVQTQHSISRDIYCVGKESTFDFLADIFEETFALFPSKYIHIGGDEAQYDRWKVCPHCQKRKADLGLETEKELQVYFNQRVQNIVRKYDKTIVGWGEIIEDGLKEQVVGMIWNDEKVAIKASEAGHYSIMTLTEYSYFDAPESNIPGEIQAASWIPPISLKKAYQLNPMLKILDEKHRPLILGASAALWADQFIHGNVLQELPLIDENRSEKYMDYLAFPRMAALSEVTWTPVNKQRWEGFEQRMASHYNRYDHAGFGYRVPQPNLLNNVKQGDGFVLSLGNTVEGAVIRYTTDGSRPNAYSDVYKEPVKVKKLADFSAITVVNRNKYSLPLYFPEKYEKFKPHGQLVKEWKPSLIMGKEYAVFEMNGTGKISENGEYLLSFWYTEGESRLDINAIEIYKNGVKTAEDIHFGYTGTEQSNNIYRFKINDYETGAEFTIKAKVRGDISNHTNGVVFIKKL